MTTRPEADAPEDLRRLGKALASPRWAQGPGGNVSVKTSGGGLWVKASGRRLADVASSDGHARVALELATRAVAGDAEAERDVFALEPRPSLETYMHALGPAIVVHTHAVGALLLACARRGRECLPKDVASIDYVRPGRGLALRIREALGPDESVVLLRSHGLVVYAASAERALELTADVDRLGTKVFTPATTFEDHLAGYLIAPIQEEPGVFARELPDRAPSVAERYLFPDAVIYATVVRVGAVRDPMARARETVAELRRPAVLVDGSGRRLAVAPTASKLADCVEVAAAHDWVYEVLSATKDAEFLDATEPAQLVTMPSERYRMQVGGSH